MILEEVKRILNCEVICGGDSMNTEIKYACGSDLMSDVLAYFMPGSLLLTGLTNIQSVRTAEIAEVKAIVYVRGKKPDKDAVDLAIKLNIPLLSTKCMMYEACGLLYSHGLPGVGEKSKG